MKESSLSDNSDALRRVIDEVVSPSAGPVGCEGRFSRASIEALGRAGVLGLTASTTVGGALAGWSLLGAS